MPIAALLQNGSTTAAPLPSQGQTAPKRYARSAHCAERALVLRRRWAGASARPAVGDLVLLADAGFVGPPDIHGADGNALLARDFLQAGGEGRGGSEISDSPKAGFSA